MKKKPKSWLFDWSKVVESRWGSFWSGLRNLLFLVNVIKRAGNYKSSKAQENRKKYRIKNLARKEKESVCFMTVW